jgi:formylglycine-generating enzyme required for sulfatase activity
MQLTVDALREFLVHSLGLTMAEWNEAVQQCGVSGDASAILAHLRRMPARDSRIAINGQPLLSEYQHTAILDGRAATLLVGNWILQDSLQAGGLATTYLAFHCTQRALVVVKELHPRYATRRDLVRRFEREFSALQRLLHPNIPRVGETLHDGMRHFFSMEYVPGKDLQRYVIQLVNANRPFPVAAALSMLRSVAEVLAHLHREGIVHRDIKPANLILGADDRVWVVDLGIALDANVDQDETVLTLPDVILGTPDYLAPEQAKDGHSVDGLADLYALGCTAYCMLAGCPPFAGDRTQVLRQHYEAPRPSARARRPDVPEWLDHLIVRMMAVDRRNRPSTAQEIVERLAAIPIPPIKLRATLDGEIAPPPVERGLAVPILHRPCSSAHISAAGRPRALRFDADGAEMILIEAQRYTLGNDLHTAVDTAHDVWLSDFYIDVVPITNRQFLTFVQKAVHAVQGSWSPLSIAPEQLMLPVQNVTWDDAMAYCRWLHRDLPTEAEWDCAATAGGGQSFPWPDGTPPARFGDFSAARILGPSAAVPPYVGSRLPNQWGCYDMSGTIAQWTKDWYDPDQFTRRRQGATTESTFGGLVLNPCRAHGGSERVVRGAPWTASLDDLRLSNRFAHRPDQGSLLVGFRTVWRPPDPHSPGRVDR